MPVVGYYEKRPQQQFFVSRCCSVRRRSILLVHGASRRSEARRSVTGAAVTALGDEVQ